MGAAYSRLRADDSGSIVFGWLGRLSITIAVVGLICFEVLSILVTRVGLEDVGATAGDRALTVFAESHNPTSAYLAADQYASSQGASLVKKTFTISDEAVSFDLEKTAPTLLLYRLDATAGYATVKTKIYAEPFVQSGSSP
jgi:hypothetical protein